MNSKSQNIQIRPPLKIGNWVIPGQPIIEKGSLQDKRIEATNAVANKIKDLFIDFFIKKQEKPSYYYKNGGIVKAQSGAALYNPAAKVLEILLWILLIIEIETCWNQKKH